MTIQETLVTVLETTGKPVYSLSIPVNGTLPCIVYQQVSDVPIRTHSDNAMKKYRFQVSCWGNKYSDVVSLSEQVETQLDLNQVNFELATRENTLDDKEVETGLYRKVSDYFIWEK